MPSDPLRIHGGEGEENAGPLIDVNADAILAELTAAEDGKCSVSIGLKLDLAKGRVAGAARLAFSRRFTSEANFITEDTHPELQMGGQDA